MKARLVALRGLGEWTADWFLARHLARPRAWPAGDLGLVKALGEHYLDGVRPSVAEARELARALRAVREPERALPAREPLLRARRGVI